MIIDYGHKVQYYETDQMGVVHHSNYIRWFEEARVDMMEQLGLGYEIMEQNNIISPVLAVSAEYKEMVRFGQSVIIRPSVLEYNSVKMTISYEVFDAKTSSLVCVGTSKHCFLDKEGKPVSLKRKHEGFNKMFLKMLTDAN